MNCRRNQSSSCGCRRLESRGIELSPAAVTKTTRSDPDEGTRKRTKGRSRWTAGQVDHTWVGMEPGWRPGKSELPASWILKCVSGVRWQLGGAPANRVLGANLLAGSKWQSYTLSLVLIFSGISKSFMSMLHGCDRWCCSHILPGTQASSILKTASEAIYEMESFREGTAWETTVSWNMGSLRERMAAYWCWYQHGGTSLIGQCPWLRP